MTEVRPGRHPHFDITLFEVEEQRVLRRMEQLFHLTRHGSLRIGQTSAYRYALVKPTRRVTSLLHTDREAMAVFSPYPDFQPRSLDAFDRILAENADEFRIEKVVRILISADHRVADRIKSLFQSTPDAPIVIPFHTSEFTLGTADRAIFDRFREFTFARDLFSMSSPLRGDLYFYGRSSIINEISAKLSSGENFGLFGLRRSGKTSIVNGVHRAIKKRNGESIVIDCQNPSIHTRRWNELLFYISSEIKRRFSISARLHSANQYNPRDAADAFLTDMKMLKRRLKKDFLAILFDEIERISFETASSPHWNEDRDFLLFWQAMRSGFQSESSPYTFLIVGTNPNAVEHNFILESDNPLFGNVEKRYIPMFNESQLYEMIDDLGSIMGVSFEPSTKARLYEDFGGHPFLSRYACSYVCRKNATRPLHVDRTLYEVGVAAFEGESGEYIEHVVDMLKELYPNEFELLKILAQEGPGAFAELAESDPRLLDHILGYGIVDKGYASYYFRIGLVKRYFELLQRPVGSMSKDDRRAEMSRRRNALEEAFREKIRVVLEVSYPAKQRKNVLLTKVTKERREALSEYSFEELLEKEGSPLYFSELRQVILGMWEKFSNVIGIEKVEFDYHMNTLNQHRGLDSHAGSISDDEFEKLRVSVRTLEGLV